MAAYGKGQMLGSGINPESFKLDFGGFADAARMQAQGLSNLGQSIGGAIQSYGEMKKLQQEDERAVQKSKSVAKAIGDLIPDLQPTLEGSLKILDDKELPLSQRKAEADAISDILNLGISEIRNKKQLQLEQSQIEAANNAAKAKAEAAAGAAPPIEKFGMPGGTQSLQWNRETKSWELPKVNMGGAAQAQQGVGVIDLVKGFEGFNPKAYGDFNQTSIGYGTKGQPGETITEEEANNRLQTELAGHAKNIQDAAAAQGVTLNENQFNALTSFDFNTGRGTDLINRFGKDPQQLASKMLEYTKAGGQDLPGLVKRRQIEAALFLGGQATANPAQGRVGFIPNEPAEQARFLTNEEKQQYKIDVNKPFAARFQGNRMISLPEIVKEGELPNKFRPATPKESEPFGGMKGQIDESTGRFYPVAESAPELKLKLLKDAAKLYSEGNKTEALQYATAAGIGGLFGNLTISDLDDYFGSGAAPAASEPVAPVPVTPAPTTPTPVVPVAPAARRPIEEVIPFKP